MSQSDRRAKNADCALFLAKLIRTAPLTPTPFNINHSFPRDSRLKGLSVKYITIFDVFL